MIKKYNQFINESDWYEDLELQEIINEIGYENGTSYSELCKTNQDPKKDFETFQNHLNDTGWTIERIRKENTDEELLSLYRALDSVNGLVDMYFYFLFEEKLDSDKLKGVVSLGGHGWEDYTVNEDEAFIRYSYGYHNTKYGKLSILQVGTIEEFKKEAMSHLQQYIYDEFSHIILSFYSDKGKGFRQLTGNQEWNFLNLKDFSISDEDRFIIYTKEICDYLNRLPIDGGKTLKDIIEIEPEDIEDKINKFLSNMDLDIDFTGNELIIWGEFKES